METAGPSCSKPISTFPGLIVNKIISCHGTIPGLALIVPQATRSRLKIYLQSAQSLNRRVYFLSECLSRAPSAIIVLYCTTYRLNLQFVSNKHEMKFAKRFQVTDVSSEDSLWRRVTLETTVLESFYSGQIASSTFLIKPNSFPFPPPTQHHCFFKN